MDDARCSSLDPRGFVGLLGLVFDAQVSLFRIALAPFLSLSDACLLSRGVLSEGCGYDQR
jgi:hypothetical protein